MAKVKNIKLDFVLLIVIGMLGLFFTIGIFLTHYTDKYAVELNSTTMNVDTYYRVNDGYIEGDAFFSVDDSYYVPYSVTIDGVRYFTYAVLNSGAYTNYKENNQYSFNNSKVKRDVFKSVFNYDACKCLITWCEENEIDVNNTLKYGLS